MVQDLIIWLGVSAALVLIVIFPISKAFLAGMASVRETIHQTDDKSAWASFSSSVKRRLGRWSIIWGLFLSVPSVLLPALLIISPAISKSPTYLILLCWKLSSMILGPWLLVLVNCLLLSPWLRRMSRLVPLVFASTLGLMFFIFVAVMGIALVIPESWMIIEFDFDKTGDYVHLWSLYFLGIAFLIFALVYRWARSVGREWFRIEAGWVTVGQ